MVVDLTGRRNSRGLDARRADLRHPLGEEVWPLRYSLPLTVAAAAALWALFIGAILLVW
jgi:hypothetical protein